MKRRVVITGMGGISPIGNTVDDIWKNAEAGQCGIGEITFYDTSERKVKVAGEVKDFDSTKYMDKMEARRCARFTQLAVAAAEDAFAQSGIDMEKEDPYRCGVNISSGIGGLGVIEKEHSRGIKRGFDRVSPLFVPMTITNMAAGITAIHLGFKGSCTCVVTACASSADAIGESFRNIRDGYAEVMAAGGAESCITELGIGGFTSMRALSESTDPKRASIPFDKERGGFVMGEAGAVLILEEYEHAVNRNAEILGEIVGYGASCDAYHMTAPLEDGSGAAQAMKNALNDASIAADQIGYINAHGTGTPMNDRCETKAVKDVFGDKPDHLLMSSTKSMTGHTLGASGALEAIITAKALENQIAPPTIGYRVADPDCDLDIVPNQSRPMNCSFAMTNSFGFGGHNVSLILKQV